MKEAFLYEQCDNGSVKCSLCAHRCYILPNKSGFCGVRTNDNGVLYTAAYGNLVASAVDPIEKKPLYHFVPGSKTYSIAVPGCNFRCGFCQNWEISQISNTMFSKRAAHPVGPVAVVNAALANNCDSIAFTYTEPVIFMEYAFDIAKLAREQGLRTVFVSNGYMTKEALDLMAPFLDACNIDLKAFTDSFYTKICKAHLQPVLDSIEQIARKGIHIEITTLVIPGENDSPEELGRIAAFISNVNNDIPWHVSRFFPRYHFLDHEVTPELVLSNAVSIGMEKGLKYVYAGNLPGIDSSTSCCNCRNVIVRRSGYTVGKPEIRNGRCVKCGTEIYGVWE
jgi:pyruvate formate lyase activating enzyme